MVVGAGLPEPRGPVTGDQRDVGERLRVLDERGTPPEASLERPRRRHRRLEEAAVEVGDQRALLAREVGDGHAGDADLPLRSPLLERMSERPACGGGVLGEGDHDRAGADGGRGGDGAVDDEMRRRRQQHAVLRAHGIALGGVDEERARPAPVRDAAELHRGGEGRAAPAPQPGPGHGVDQPWRARRAGAVLGQVLVQGQ
jgi:hypothetical protein